jgi:hypothetical protein
MNGVKQEWKVHWLMTKLWSVSRIIWQVFQWSFSMRRSVLDGECSLLWGIDCLPWRRVKEGYSLFKTLSTNILSSVAAWTSVFEQLLISTVLEAMMFLSENIWRKSNLSCLHLYLHLRPFKVEMLNYFSLLFCQTAWRRRYPDFQLHQLYWIRIVAYIAVIYCSGLYFLPVSLYHIMTINHISIHAAWKIIVLTPCQRRLAWTTDKQKFEVFWTKCVVLCIIIMLRQNRANCF